MEKVKDSKGKLYLISNGTSYYENTPEELIRVLDQCLMNRNTIRVYYGDVKTGIVWNEEHDVRGRIGRSTGTIKIALLCHPLSHGGGALLSDCILKVVDIKTKRVVYQADNFIAPVVGIKNNFHGDSPYIYEVYINGELYGGCKTLRQAKLLRTKMS